MGSSIKRPDNIAKLTKTSGTTLTLGPSTVAVGAFQYVTTGTLTLNTAIVGAGGVDASIQASSLYYVYAVVSSGNSALIASTSSTAPTGYSQSRCVGSFNTDASSQISLVEPIFNGCTNNTGALTVSGGIIGRSDGGVTPSGSIGEVITGGFIWSAVTPPASNAATTVVTITSFPAGIWSFSASGTFRHGNALTLSVIYGYISKVSGTGSVNSTSGSHVSLAGITPATTPASGLLAFSGLINSNGTLNVGVVLVSSLTGSAGTWECVSGLGWQAIRIA